MRLAILPARVDPRAGQKRGAEDTQSAPKSRRFSQSAQMV